MSIGVNCRTRRSSEIITTLDGATVRAMAGLEPETDIDVMFGGPTLPGVLDRRRAARIRRSARQLLSGVHRPRRATAPTLSRHRNVRGLLSASYPLEEGGRPAHGGALKIILDKLDAIGYGVSFNLYDAANFGAFQHRERVVLIAKRDGTKCRYLTPTNSDDPKWGLPAWHTFRQAVADVEGMPQHYTHYVRTVWIGCVWCPKAGAGQACRRTFRRRPWERHTGSAAARPASIGASHGTNPVRRWSRHPPCPPRCSDIRSRTVC